MDTILVVDDEKNICSLINKIFKNEYNVLMVGNGKDALENIKSKEIDLVLLDQNMPGFSGLETLEMIKKLDDKIPVIMITAYGRIEYTVKAMKLGANDYIEKPFDTKKMKIAISHALEIRKLSIEVEHLRSELDEKYSFHSIVGKSPVMQDVYKLINSVANSDISVLVLGESGTGKELVARAIHHSGNYKHLPFVPINCAAIPDQLLESELFGYEKGAFSGAMITKKGKIEMADGGTLFLDEIGDMAEQTQAKLLRFLQDGQFSRVGGVDTIHVNVRIISATNKNVDVLMSKGQFREDLYFRINAVQIELPSLTDRKEDILILTNHFIEKFNKQYDSQIKGVEHEAMQSILNYDWPGNVRELENTIQSAMILSNGELLIANVLPKRMKRHAETPSAANGATIGDEINLNKHVEDMEITLINNALEKADQNRTHAAKILQISLRNLQYKIKKYGIE